MFDFSKYYKKIAAELPNNCVIGEVGVADCDSALFLANELKSIGKNFKFYFIDSLQYGGTEQLNTIIKKVIESGLSENIEVLPLDSLNASCKFNDGYFDFIFIDASHEYELTKADIRLWYRKVKDEAIIAGHDMNMEEVRRAVLEVVPQIFVRNDIKDRNFEPEIILHTEKTDNDYGLWWFKKQWYLTLN